MLRVKEKAREREGLEHELHMPAVNPLKVEHVGDDALHERSAGLDGVDEVLCHLINEPGRFGHGAEALRHGAHSKQRRPQVVHDDADHLRARIVGHLGLGRLLLRLEFGGLGRLPLEGARNDGALEVEDPALHLSAMADCIGGGDEHEHRDAELGAILEDAPRQGQHRGAQYEVRGARERDDDELVHLEACKETSRLDHNQSSQEAANRRVDTLVRGVVEEAREARGREKDESQRGDVEAHGHDPLEDAERHARRALREHAAGYHAQDRDNL
mmetsp:Transcript_22061/g.68729  ORF Transcript_22061/g.68729 Transcript_22061/m.68729 type:complete len:272 (-) Transcript_22061:379-1194(-)